ncbi:MAG: sigma-70 family RNA polymerase sigma factor [Alphaproteobacteria bacterium]|nr:sigma-70 family RNA polymerase sigma factor [Alphaproteobacteria bacterium]
MTLDVGGGTGLDETALLARLKAGDGRAFEILVRSEGGSMLAVARRILRDDAAAQDCVQEAFLSAHRNLETFEPRASLGAWLHRITVNACLMRMRKHKRLAETSIDELLPNFNVYGTRVGEPQAEIRDPEDELGSKQIRHFVRDRINELPDGYRIALQLRDIDGYSTREAAEAMGIAEGALKVRLHRARAALKKLIEPLWEKEGV